MKRQVQLEFGREYLIGGGYNCLFKYAGIEKGWEELSHHFIRTVPTIQGVQSMHVPIFDLRINEEGVVTDCNKWYSSDFVYPESVCEYSDEKEYLRLIKLLQGVSQ